ncbi:right-handed parallel beta-helix repeat-containing protein [Hymenobacter caeli]|uniref:Right handed beta helix domain-containing protein n=1 Tax=Hymenobacter caeli TaxID=2735894 RepID=A0ABX2FXN4_9BACT|nr:right-handed parallel beta-helix repeat-containing protein [Hymenobacter caeli]NRT21174.1 hypothetical protein [Hymenobacter caeli]
MHSWQPVLFLALAGALRGAAPGVPAPAVLRKDLKKDFGAVGDGLADDQAAFGRAAAFFNARARTPAGAGPAVLFIPRGVYRVGQQLGGGEAYRTGAPVLALVGCRNLTVTGQDSARTEIRYADGRRYGAFDPATGRAYRSPAAVFTNIAYAATGGVCLGLKECANVVVANLALNGNSAHLELGGFWGDTGIQLACDGVFVDNSRDVTLRNVAVHHFGRDGIQVLNRLARGLDDPARDNIVLENSTFDYNGRQGLSVTGASGLRAVRCSFSHTARVQNPTAALGAGHALFSNPAAGVDLEPEGGYVAHVAFARCRFVDNGGQGLVADRPGGPHPPATADVRLTDCTLWGTTNWSAWVTQPGFQFQGCRFYGAFVHGCDAATAAEATAFDGCTFEDRPYAGRPALGPYLFFSDRRARRLRFTACRFVRRGGPWLHLVAPDPADTAAGPHFLGCTFEAGPAPAGPGAGPVWTGAVFGGRAVLRDAPGLLPPHNQAEAAGAPAELSGLTTVRAPGRLELRARTAAWLVRGGFDVGRGPASLRDSARVVVGEGNALVLAAAAPADTAALYVGPTARLLVQKGGALELRRYARLVVAGAVVVEPGAYFFRDPLARVRTVGAGTLRVAPGAVAARHPTLSPGDD